MKRFSLLKGGMGHFLSAAVVRLSCEDATLRYGPALALHRCLWSSGLPRLDRGVVETIAALNQFFQPLGEACCWSTVDRLVIKADRQTQIVPDGDVPVNDPRLLANAAHRHPENTGGER